MLTILGKRSSINVRKVLWTCEEIGLAYQQEDYGSGFKPLDTPEFQRLNPNSLVPVLLDDDFVLWESNSICRYLARKAERWDLLPAEPQPAAEVEHWMDWQATEFNNAWRHAFLWGWCVKILAFRIRRRLKRALPLDPLCAHCRGAVAAYRGVDSRRALHPGRYRAGAVGASLEDDALCASGNAGRGALVYGAQSAPGVYAPWQ